MRPSKKITIRFNVMLILFSTCYGIFNFALSDAAKGISLEGIILTSLVDMVRFLVVMFLVAYFVREFWNRLIADIFAIRMLEYREAIAIVVVMGIIAA
ncbi:hypothetical protein [Rhodopirellula sp. SWK7]|uniref:hypothetical protein n=1 Tax=Rhodopirellula sp. SWK7 TaxID=595460 RepID=UPI0002BF34BC|nr:hypothetical protein [Rhodopirellula sp. SWK7]EMI46608.1 putative membrane protein [Rhodopirellula sp. SWK7]